MQCPPRTCITGPTGTDQERRELISKLLCQDRQEAFPPLSASDELLTEKDGSEEPPGTSRRPSLWQDVPAAKWNDWRWQLAHRIHSGEELRKIINLTPEEEAGIFAQHRFRMDITPYFASLIDPDDPNCPLRRQVIPTARELVNHTEDMDDSLGEDAQSPVRGLVHRYPDRVLMLVTTQCASYCRYCTRSRLVGEADTQFSRTDYDAQIDYIARTPSVRDVLISGGDPLILAPNILGHLLSRIRAIPHVEIIRIGTRVPIFLPQRIDEELVSMLRRFHPLWMNVHINHPKELTPEAGQALERLADAGIPLGAQTVLLAGVNDCPNVMKTLVQNLVRLRVRPYYLYQCDLVHGAAHFRTSVAKGIEIIESLRGHTTGFAVPTYAIDSPGGGGKVPIMPQYLISQSDDRVVVRNFEGLISTYAQPADYHGHKAAECEYCRQRASEGGQEGIEELLQGNRLTILPEGYSSAHRREHDGAGLAGNLQSAEPLVVEGGF
jgi:lysine 2,3-aminomutase